MNKITTIDLGSNSFRVLIYDCLNLKTIDEYHEIVGMADGLETSKIISEAAILRVIKAIKTSSKKMNYSPKEAICVTTAAMRLANNSKDVLERFFKTTQASFKIIDGKEEAKLTLIAVKYALKREKIKSENFILLDIGGGSTEIIINTKDTYKTHSFDFGIVTLTQKNFSKKELFIFLKEKKSEIKNFLNTLDKNLEEYFFVATAGTPTTIAAIKLGQDFLHYNKEKINGTILNLKDLNTCLDIFSNSSKNEIISLVGSGRIDFVEIGVYIYKAIFEVLQKKESIVLDDGLKEGIALNYVLNKA